MENKIYAKTELGHDTIQTRNQSLTRLERSVLIMIDGRKSGAELLRMSRVIGADGGVLARLLELGMAQATMTLGSVPARRTAAAQAAAAVTAEDIPSAPQRDSEATEEHSSEPDLLSDSQLDREVEQMLLEPLKTSSARARDFEKEQSQFSRTAEIEPIKKRPSSFAYANEEERLTIVCDTLRAEIRVHLGLRGMDLTVRAGNAVTLEALRSVADDLIAVLDRRKERGAAATAQAVRSRLANVFDTPLDT